MGSKDWWRCGIKNIISAHPQNFISYEIRWYVRLLFVHNDKRAHDLAGTLARSAYNHKHQHLHIIRESHISSHQTSQSICIVGSGNITVLIPTLLKAAKSNLLCVWWDIHKENTSSYRNSRRKRLQGASHHPTFFLQIQICFHGD